MSTEEQRRQEIWGDDLLNRKADADFLTGFLTNRIAERKARGAIGSYVINLDSGWGTGKTFFLERFQQQLSQAGHIAVYVNAWRDDHADDPMLAVMSAIDEAIAPFLRRRKALERIWRTARGYGVEVVLTVGKHAALSWIKKNLGEGVGELKKLADASNDSDEVNDGEGVAEAVGQGVGHSVEAILDRVAEQALARFRDDQRSVKNFRNQLGTLLEQIDAKNAARLPLFVLVDELDRCRPTYAIKLLERIKHLFDVSNVAFVVATDSAQLRHSIKAVYGEEFDGAAYLRRFFDRTYKFDDPAVEPFVQSLFDRIGFPTSNFEMPAGNEVLPFLVSASAFFGLSLRDVEQCVDVLHTVATVWTAAAKIHVPYLLPLVIAFQQGNASLFEALEYCRAAETKELVKRQHVPLVFLDFVDYSSERGRREIRVDLASYLGELLHMMPMGSPEIFRQEQDSEPGMTIWRMLTNRVRSTSDHEAQLGLDLLRRYPSMVRSAGRFKEGKTDA